MGEQKMNPVDAVGYAAFMCLLGVIAVCLAICSPLWLPFYAIGRLVMWMEGREEAE